MNCVSYKKTNIYARQTERSICLGQLQRKFVMLDTTLTKLSTTKFERINTLKAKKTGRERIWGFLETLDEACRIAKQKTERIRGASYHLRYNKH